MPEKRLNFSDRKGPKKSYTFSFLLIVVIVLGGLYLLYKFASDKNPLAGQQDRNNTAIPHFDPDSLTSLSDSIDLALELPEIHKEDEVVFHHYYSLCYSEPDEEPAWVAYVLKDKYVGGHEKRPRDFMPDPLVITGSATTEDYIRSGYDRGHQVPAADMKWSQDAIEETFYMSNVCPQVHAFNDGVWEDLEDAVRRLAMRDRKLYVVCGPVLKGNLKKIGRQNRVTVPEYFYKVIMDTKAPGDHSISAFIIPNRAVKAPYWTYSVSLDSVEKVTGIHFFPRLKARMQKAATTAASPQLWQGI